MKSKILLVILSGLFLSMISTNIYSQSLQLGYRSGGIRNIDALRLAHRAHKLKKQKRIARLNDGKIGRVERMRIVKSRNALKRSLAHTYLNRKRSRLAVAIRL